MSSPKVEDVISAPASNYHQNHGLNLQFDLQGYFSHEMLRSFQHTLCFFLLHAAQALSNSLFLAALSWTVQRLNHPATAFFQMSIQ